MKIVSLTANLIEQPFAVPYKLSERYGTMTHTRAVIVRIETDTGIIGLGEANPMPPFTEENPFGVMEVLQRYIWPAIRGEDPRNINTLNERLDLILKGNLTAKGAIDMALHDIAGKSAGIPVHQLLGGARTDQLKVLWPLSSGTPDEDRAVIDTKMAEGFGSFMLKMGTLSIDEEIARLEALYGHYQTPPDITVDANQGWSRSQALDFSMKAAGFPLVLIEQPLKAEDVSGMAQVRQAARQPVSADEGVQSIQHALEFLNREAADVLSIKVSKNGGIAAGRKIAELAHHFGAQCLMNSMLEFGITQAASLQLGVTLPNLLDTGHAYMSTLRLAGDVTDFSDFVKDGTAHLPDGPGLGITLNPQKLEDYTVRHEQFAD
ncbi:mandelate racemase/muconate lactonizing enzyme family protein [Roseibium sp.]|uniref:mandelate racemase/muconate lactonizing enzyme family protein n=1 Tax=Roseibium sp. TaxID=1936156 RepID=UPI003B51D3D0